MFASDGARLHSGKVSQAERWRRKLYREFFHLQARSHEPVENFLSELGK
jgi:hypothetical protein